MLYYMSLEQKEQNRTEKNEAIEIIQELIAEGKKSAISVDVDYLQHLLNFLILEEESTLQLCGPEERVALIFSPEATDIVTRQLQLDKKLIKEYKKKQPKLRESTSALAKLVTSKPEDLTKVLEYINRAKQDLALAKDSFDKTYLELVGNNLQQAVEKLTKAYSLYFCYHVEDDLRPKVGHFAFRVHAHMLRKGDDVPFLTGLPENVDLTKYASQLEALENYEKNPTAMQKITIIDKEMEKHLEVYEQVVILSSKELSKKKYKGIIQLSQTLLLPFDLHLLVKICNGLGYLLLPLAIANTPLESRYPNKTRSIDYASLGVIQHFNKIRVHLVQLMNDLESTIKLLQNNIQDYSEIKILASLILIRISQIENDEDIGTIIEALKADKKIEQRINNITQIKISWSLEKLHKAYDGNDSLVPRHINYET